MRRGIARFYRRDLDGAISDFSRAIELNPRAPWFYHARAVTEQVKNELFAAQSDYSHCITLDKDFALVYEGRGLVASRLGALDEAIADYSRETESGMVRHQILTAEKKGIGP